MGYRVKSKHGTQFRTWANKVLKDHIVKGYTLNEQRLRQQQNQLTQIQQPLARALARAYNEESICSHQRMLL